MATGDSASQAEAAAQGVPERVDVKHRQALAEFHRQYYHGLVRYLAKRIGSWTEAEDVAQQAYGNLLALDHPETIGILNKFLWKTATNLARDLQAQRSNRARLDVRVLYASQELAPSPEADLVEQQRMALIEKAIDELPPKCLEAFILRVVEGFKVAEVARRMGISERMAKKYVARALQFCQEYVTAAAVDGASPHDP